MVVDRSYPFQKGLSAFAVDSAIVSTAADFAFEPSAVEFYGAKRVSRHKTSRFAKCRNAIEDGGINDPRADVRL